MDCNPGPIVLMGSGETSNIGGQLFEKLASNLLIPPVVSVLETPAGFELNSERVAGRVAEFIEKRLQNYRPKVTVIPARSREYPHSTESPELAKLLWDTNLIFLGPGSPSYTVRHLSNSLIWHTIQACHRHGSALIFASAATIAIGKLALPIYEIYKVGEDPYWKPGLDLFSVFGLNLILIPHWNNADGGAELDTSRCYIGEKRLNQLINVSSG